MESEDALGAITNTMQTIELGYGGDSVSVSLAGDYRLLRTSALQAQPLTDFQIGAALDAPIATPPLDEIFHGGDSVLIVVSDATRATASSQIVNLLVRRLIQLGISQSDIAIVFATGIHRPVTPEEKVRLLTSFITQRIKTIDHDAYDEEELIDLGKTERGTPIELNRNLVRFKHVVLTGAIGFHYFAGFSGGRKSICPGLASARMIAATHMFALDFEHGGRRAGVGTGRLKGNAVHEECESAAREINPALVVNTVVDGAGRAVSVYAGDWRIAHELGCNSYLLDHSIEIDDRRDLVIASCGGLPWDINLIQAHKTLDMAAQACSEGGTIILLAECIEGLGRPDFLKWFDEPNAAALEVRLCDHYEVNGQTAWALLTKAERFRIFLVSNLADDVVRRMRMVPAKSISNALSEAGPSQNGYVLPHGAALLPVLRYD